MAPQRVLRYRSAAVAGALLTTTLVALPTPGALAAPTVEVTTVASGLTIPWDLTFIGDLMLFDTRAGQVWSKRSSAAPQRVTIPLPRIFAKSEAGLMGMVADPAAAANGRFFTCQATAKSDGTAQDVRVLRWRLTSDTVAVADGAPVITGLPLTSGRHTGCRLRFGADGRLYVGTGDTAVGTNPQNKSVLGGKVLRVNADGSIPTDNPFYASGGNARYVWTYGHRNVQGLDRRPGTSEMWSVEQGSTRDDEVNLLSRGGNYGWDPVPGYDESTPMTDLTKFPSARRAKWSSGSSTIATSGGAFIQGSAWGRWQGALAVALLKGEGVRLMLLDLRGTVTATTTLPAAGGFGRIRTVQHGPDGSLYLLTSNGQDDKIIKIRPTARPPAVAAGENISPVGVSAARTGSDIYAFVRSTGDRIYYKRSTDDGMSWPSSWVNAGVTSTSAPSVASSAAGRIDLVTTNAAGAVHTSFLNGKRVAQRALGGAVVSAHVSSLGDGTLDVFVVSPNGRGYQKHFNRTSWSGWQGIGGSLTSALSASVNVSTKVTTVTGRGTDGRSWQRTVAANGSGSAWTQQPSGLVLWSTRALGDTRTGVGPVGVGSGSDHNAVVDRGTLVMGVSAFYTSAPDVITRPDATFIMFGRSTDGGLWLFDTGTGGFRNRRLGGIVR